jgi:1-acyl-sn-glycerol-3-phosphate acyltransferase
MKASALAGIVAGAARFISGVQASWRDGAPQSRQSVFFANHTSHLDFVVLWASLPADIRARTRPVAAQDYWDRGLRRALAVNVFSAVLVPRSGEDRPRESRARSTIDRIAAEMGDEYSLIIFPEGTRGTGESVAPFKSGLYHLCLEKPGLQLVPAFIENLNRVLPKGQFLPVPLISRVTFGAPASFDPLEPKLEFLARMRDAVCGLKER